MRWKPHLTVAAVIEVDGRFLIVEEKTDEGVRLNQPAGHVEEGESLQQAVIRETLEETCGIFEPKGIIGFYRWQPPNKYQTYMRMAYFGVWQEASYSLSKRDAQIIACHWLSYDEILKNANRCRSPLVLKCIEDFLTKETFPLTLVRDEDT